jgi:hypothetical protein
MTTVGVPPVPGSRDARLVRASRRPVARRVEGGAHVFRSFVASVAVVAVFITLEPDLYHWMVLPLVGCGTVIGADASRWLRGDLELFSPRGLSGVFGFHFFLLVPLLNVYWDEWPLYIPLPDDFRPWLGLMGFINFGSLLIYKLALGRIGYRGVSDSDDPGPTRRRRSITRRASNVVDRSDGQTKGTIWLLDPAKAGLSFFVMLGVAVVAQVAVLAAVGGLGAYVAEADDNTGVFDGSGWLLTVAESAPTLAVAAWVISLRGRRPSTPVLGLVIGSFILFQFVFSGLRGSRGNVVYAVIVMLGVIHYWVRPVTRRAIAVGAVFGVLFMYGYGLYKSAGVEGAEALRSYSEQSRVAEETGRTLPALFVGDLGRADIQAVLLHNRYDSHWTEPPMAYGRTYLSGLATLVPGATLGISTEGKIEYGTDWLYGVGRFDSGFEASNIYGLAGEMMLNFGPAGIPFVFALLGWSVRACERWAQRLHPDDARRPLVALLAVLCLLGVSSDLGNVGFAALKFGLLFVVALYLGSTRVRRGGGAQLAAPGPAPGRLART